VSGLEGDDVIDGGAGVDSLDGGDGTDSCVAGETVTSCESDIRETRYRVSTHPFGTRAIAILARRLPFGP
jgi:hypothetical protein